MSYVVLNTRPPRPLVIAHRGARGHAPENTLAAANLAQGVGADLWELDVNLTRDGELVIMHDDTLERTTDAPRLFPDREPFRVCDMTLEEIRRLDAGTWFIKNDPFGRIEAGEIGPRTLRGYVGEAVPTLEEALRLTRDRGWKVNVEIKDHAGLRGHQTVTKAVVECVRRLDMIGRVLISSFQHEYLLEVHALCPDLPTGALVEKNRPADPVALCRELHAAAYHPDRRVLEPDDLAALREAGLAVNVWTVNDMDEARRLLDADATGIITDFPATCLDLLGRERGPAFTTA